MNTYTINGLQYTFTFEDADLIIRALHFKTLTQFKCIVSPIYLKAYQLIDSMQTLYKILCDEFAGDADAVYDIQTNTVNITIEVGYKYMKNTLYFKLLTEQDLSDKMQLDNKMTWFNKKLNILTDDYEPLFDLIREMQEQIDELQHATKFSRRVIQLEGIYFDRVRNVMIDANMVTLEYVNFGNHVLPQSSNYNHHVESDALARAASVLRRVTFYSNEYMDVIEMINHFPNLETITISNTTWVTLDILHNLTNLTNITLTGNKVLVDIAALGSNIIDKLIIKDCRKIAMDVINTFAINELHVENYVNTGIFTDINITII